ncbi:MAG: prepilin-type N-terminal cleavage/methylation domain-containing protein [Verrucomicrobiota bacterium]|jgi:prepilin-type N-terminal cleavage/methylation domain-containing protein
MTSSSVQSAGGSASPFAHCERRGFTLIELILVMALLTIVISLTAPKLSRFFHGRTLDSEARRLLALTRSGQSRAVSEGVPMDLWVDAGQGTFGLEAEPSYETSDPKAVDFTLDSGLQLEVVNKTVVAPANTMNRGRQASIASTPRVNLVHASLPTIRFLPDGSISESSPQMLHLTSGDGGSLWLAQSRDALNYEIRNTDK